MCVDCVVFFFKQKTAYEMRISDWSSDVCSSDLVQCAPSAGYIVPRIQSLAMNEAARMVEEGVASAEDIDTAVRLGFGLRFSVLGLLEFIEIGRASCRERVCQYV